MPVPECLPLGFRLPARTSAEVVVSGALTPHHRSCPSACPVLACLQILRHKGARNMSFRSRLLQVKLASGAVLLCSVLAAPLLHASDEHAQINFVDDQIAFEFVGQVTNFPPTPTAPLGSSNQYGYLTVVRGID